MKTPFHGTIVTIVLFSHHVSREFGTGIGTKGDTVKKNVVMMVGVPLETSRQKFLVVTLTNALVQQCHACNEKSFPFCISKYIYARKYK
jgi:hypothetical protein